MRKGFVPGKGKVGALRRSVGKKRSMDRVI